LGITIIDVVFFIIVIYLLLTKISKLEHRIKAMQNTIDQLTSKVKLPEPAFNKELRQLIKEGKEVEAIRQARNEFGLSLVEGKQYVDKLKSGN
jgi:ribosomal protein L7/L12